MKKQSYFISTLLLLMAVLWGCQEDSIQNYPKSNLRSLVSFIIKPEFNPGNVWSNYTGVIDQDQKLIKVTLNSGVDLTKIRPEIILSPWSTSFPKNLDPIDLTPDTVEYKVVAESGKTAIYSVVKTIVPYAGNTILSVYFPTIKNAEGDFIRQVYSSAMKVTVPAETDITNVVPAFEFAGNSHNCQFDKPIDVPYDFTNPVSFKVTSEDGKKSTTFTIQLIY